VDGIVFVKEMTVVLPNHFHVFVAKKFTQVFQFGRVLLDEIGGEGVP
jgi:hypothetical protein